ncbi:MULTISPECIES: aspartate/glutamate racemase family protein [unclassified Mesorhizobium]|uniref:aspartate/glutamate racemase family protein n=1 Tax=unclassified Mesorhizobium TaxID=325217 RepID=UPI000FCA56EA|nr:MULTISPECIES: aspartate/glutamate racemase family protein [unclassified Mesorhizobium]RUW01204.1 aspartate/glutamate racemase family protein [Mesorhizobium sp. M1A.F.Ca.IN.020.04.1.1]RUW10234.1 aspartate/glutamate racemase family protein [Mesorhizobium sp. M1A.F.Ca.IN.020.03.1.1]RWF68901.1 MAG: aspartate/glutamate racemase family protein [Mesorhizobium sp.]RWG11174.1 MAG: aspartate/glutamate racemase family protein [Mesorhizobium sp.]RWG26362.1 MAG: aspartate/glutamate racemase family prote
MRILVINPNTTASMTGKIGKAATSVASSGTEIVAVNPADGPPSIEGYFDEVFAVPGIIAEMRKAPAADAYVIACFDDTGLDAARCATEVPVIGIGEAAFHLASLVAGKFSVVTTLARSVPAIEHNLAKYGLSSRCAKVRSSEVAVLELERPGSNARHRISDEIARAIREDHAEAIVLGCAGMADLAHSLSEEHGVPVLDGVVCAITLAESLFKVGLKTSKIGGYAAPRGKRFAGIFASASPPGAGSPG